MAVTVTDASSESDTQTFEVMVNAPAQTTPSVVAPDPALLAAVRQALAIPAGQPVTQADWAELTSLTADSNQVLSLQGLQYAVNLESLTLVPSNFSAPGHLTDLSPLAPLTNLKSLTLQDCGLNDNSIQTLPSQPALQMLDLRYNSITTVPSEVASLPKLTNLFVYGNPLNTNPVSSYYPTPVWCASLAGELLTVDIAPNDPQKVMDNIDPSNTFAAYAGLDADFYNLPLEIYQYLVNTIQYQPYYGAMKGPLAVLQTAAGNDWDTDSLLVALLSFVSQQMTGGDGITMNYVLGQIQVPIQQAEAYVGAKDATAAENILQFAGQSPVEVISGGQPIAMQFDHTWLQVQITTSTGTVTTDLDPSWKFLDFQPGTASLPSGTDLLTSLVPYSDFSTVYLSTPQTESAAEFYEGQAEQYLKTSDPTETVADVAYTGPIQPQVFSAPLPALPYHVVSQNVGGQSVPAGTNGVTDEVEITLSNDNTSPYETLFDETFQVPEVVYTRLTINPNINVASGKALPQLLQSGDISATSSAAVSNPATTSLTLTITYTSPLLGDDYSKQYPLFADQYACIALDANQYSAAVVTQDRATVNAQEVAQGQGFNTDAEFGGILQLAAATYYLDANQGEALIDGLTGAVPDYSVVASGLTTSNSAVVPTAAVDNGQVQLPYQPEGLTIDLGDNTWHALPIDSSDTQTINRMDLLGDEASSMEGLVWEELTDYQSISTVEAFQLANQASIPFKTIYASDVANDTPTQAETYVGGQLPYLPSTIVDSISGYLLNSTYNYTVYVPTHELTLGAGTVVNGVTVNANPEGPWVGVGFTLTPTKEITGLSFLIGTVTNYMIQGEVNGVWEEPHGGGGVGNSQTVTDPTSKSTSTVAGEPINPANGDVSHVETDFTIPNLGTPLEMVRSYDSYNTVTSGASWSDRGMGDGWSFSYSDEITLAATLNDPADSNDSQGTLVWFTSSGLLLQFLPDGTGYTTPAGIFGTLTTWTNGTSSGYLWADATGSKSTFTTIGSIAYVTQISDRYGNGVYIDRNTSGQIVEVCDLFEYNQHSQNISLSTRYLKFTYTGNDITSITDYTGRTWNYTYSSTPYLIGVGSASTAAANLTTEGTADWIHWGDSSLNRKLGGGSLISDESVVVPGTALLYSDDQRSLSWTDGTPTSTSAGDTAGIFNSYGFSFTVPADTQPRTLVVYAGGNNSAGAFTATLSDASAAAFVATMPLTSGEYDRNFTLTYEAGLPGQTLTVTWVKTSGSGYVTLSGAALSYSARRLLSVTAPITSTAPLDLTQYAYCTDPTLNDLLESVTDADGNVTQFAYYANRRGFQETDPEGDVQSFSYNLYPNCNRTAFTDENGQTTYYDYDNNGNVIQQVNPDGTTLAYTWSSNGLKTSDTDEYGQTESYGYDSNGNVLTFTDRASTIPTTTYTYTTCYSSVTGTYSYNNVATITNDVDGALTVNSYYPDGSLETTTVSPNGTATGSPPTFSAGAIEFTTTYTYPVYPSVDRGEPASIKAPNGYGVLYGYTTYYVYNEAGQVKVRYSPTFTTSTPTPNGNNYGSLGYIARLRVTTFSVTCSPAPTATAT